MTIPERSDASAPIGAELRMKLSDRCRRAPLRMWPVDLFTWRRSVFSAQGPRNPQVRLVLGAVSLNMNSQGDGAWQSQETIAEQSGLSVRSVKRHLETAERGGWLYRERARIPGRKWLGTVYGAVVPLPVYESLPQRPWEADPTWRRGDTVTRASVSPNERRDASEIAIEVPTATAVGDSRAKVGDSGDQSQVTSFGTVTLPLNSPKNSPHEGALARTAIDPEIDETEPEQEAERKPQPLAPARPVSAPRRLSTPGSFARTEEPEPVRFTKAQAAARDFGITEPDRLARMFGITPERALEAIE